MATSGTSAFSLDIADVIEEAFDQAGVRSRSGWDMKTARRSLDLLCIEWQNRGLNFWTVEETTATLSASTANVTLEADTVDVIEAIIRTGSGTTQVDYPITRISVSQYASIPNKNTEGRPSNFWIDKQRSSTVMYLWPVPDVGSYTLAYWKLRRIEDTGDTPTETDPDVPARFVPALTAGLAFRIAKKYPELREGLPILKADYEEQWEFALGGDRDRSSLYFKPWTPR